jgi:hypothetical protein
MEIEIGLVEGKFEKVQLGAHEDIQTSAGSSIEERFQKVMAFFSRNLPLGIPGSALVL